VDAEQAELRDAMPLLDGADALSVIQRWDTMRAVLEDGLASLPALPLGTRRNRVA
jgi:hypothetical protein